MVGRKNVGKSELFLGLIIVVGVVLWFTSTAPPPPPQTSSETSLLLHQLAERAAQIDKTLDAQQAMAKLRAVKRDKLHPLVASAQEVAQVLAQLRYWDSAPKLDTAALRYCTDTSLPALPVYASPLPLRMYALLLHCACVLRYCTAFVCVVVYRGSLILASCTHAWFSHAHALRPRACYHLSPAALPASCLWMSYTLTTHFLSRSPRHHLTACLREFVTTATSVLP